ncbi:hypothetical protein COCVIDRAFT_22097 [Bipolaris victoriae FI3]|uniref:Uncharacterized protein n=1 Tax=Bipolaris victoriae (strain FI3) TaxID=930091 RepID=W7EPE1_BIPV3|nr:hypothetical protein COCVIDRAFT_22097 [Bipolaris victoriae FI3]
MKMEKGVRITQQGHAATIWEDIHQLTKGLNMEFAPVKFPGSLQINDKIHPQLTEITKQKGFLTCMEDITAKGDSTSASLVQPVMPQSNDPKKVKKWENFLEKGDVWYILDYSGTPVQENQKAWKCNTNHLVEGEFAFTTKIVVLQLNDDVRRTGRYLTWEGPTKHTKVKDNAGNKITVYTGDVIRDDLAEIPKSMVLGKYPKDLEEIAGAEKTSFPVQPYTQKDGERKSSTPSKRRNKSAIEDAGQTKKFKAEKEERDSNAPVNMEEDPGQHEENEEEPEYC